MNPDSLAAWLTFLEARRPEHEMMLGLERADTVARKLLPASFFTPDRPIKVITVAGTNGKGSTVAYLSAILQAAGIRAGAWTSPHLLEYNERIRIDGEMVSDHLICEAFARIEQIRADTFLSYYEFGALAALDIFVREQVDVILLEVGLGGRLDAVNIVDADVSIVTTVDLDHQDWLGDTVEAIAREKAGVFRCGRPAICGERFPARSLLEHIADIGAIRLQNDHEFSLASVNGEMYFCGRLASGELRTVTGLTVPALPPVSAACALQALLWLEPELSDEAFREGFAAASLAGRCQQQSAKNSRGATVNIILDVAHNPQAARYLAGKLEQIGKGSVRAVLGMLDDKDMAGVIEPLKTSFQHWYVASVGYEARARSGGDLADRLKSFNQSVSNHDTVPDALNQALAEAAEGDTLVVLGSFHTVAESLVCLKQLPDA